MRRSDAFLLFLAGAAMLLEWARLDARRRVARGALETAERAAVVRRLGLTDLCLFTEARYTRHPSMSDRFTPFGDHPSALEHYPSGSLAAPPR